MLVHKILRKLTIAIALILALAIPAQAAPFAAIVTTGAMGVYADAGCGWQIGALPMTTVVTVESYEGDTALISLGGNRGYAKIANMTAIDSLATRVTVNTYSRIYQYPTLSSRWLSLPMGMELNLLAVNGPWAMVENGGIVAYTNAAHLTKKEVVVQPEVPAPEAPANDAVITETFPATVTATSMPVYQQASAHSKYLGLLPQGIGVTVHAYNSSWAYIELNGCFGFAPISCMTRVTEPAQPEAAPSVPDTSNLTTPQIIYLFLTRTMGLNSAVACGILANIEKECSFKVTAASYDGGYGLCQWTGARNTRLKNWCKDNGYDYTTLEGQLWYLKYELENWHPKTLRYLQGIENSPAGAYEAAYYFCYNFEVPANRAKRSVERGNLAKDKYWQTYAA